MKRGMELNIKVLVILIIALLVLVVSIIFFSSVARQIFANLLNKIKEAFSLLNATKI
jgi:outer membrane lipoprotein-sorting protein